MPAEGVGGGTFKGYFPEHFSGLSAEDDESASA
jgi:hypothetical protein